MITSDNNLPFKCREWRVKKGIKQAEIAEKCGLNRSQISRFERGEIISYKTLAVYLSLGFKITRSEIINYLKGGGDNN